MQFLEKQARKGWMLENSEKMAWTFYRIEPKNLHFAVVYYPQATEFDAEPTEEQKILYDFCAHTGWKWITNKGYLQIFCNEYHDPVPIETDPSVELENIHKTMKAKNKHVLLLWLTGLLLILSRVFSLVVGNGSIADQNYDKIFIVYWIVALLAISQDWIHYKLWHRRATRAITEGMGFIETRTNRVLYFALLTVMILLVVLLNFVFSPMSSVWQSICILLASFLGIIFVASFTKHQKTKDGSIKKKRVRVYVISCVAVIILGLGVTMISFLLQESRFGIQIEEKYEVFRYKAYTQACRIFGLEYEPEMHLHLEDIYGDASRWKYRKWKIEENDTEIKYHLGEYNDNDEIQFAYTVTVPQKEEYYESCLQFILENSNKDYQEHIINDWNVDRVYKSPDERNSLLTFFMTQDTGHSFMNNGKEYLGFERKGDVFSFRGLTGEEFSLDISSGKASLGDISITINEKGSNDTINLANNDSILKIVIHDNNTYILEGENGYVCILDKSGKIIVDLNEHYSLWILCYDTHIVELALPTQPSEEEMAYIVEKLSCLP